MISVTDLADVFVEVTDTLVDEYDVIDALDRLSNKAISVSGAAVAGLVLSDHRGRIRFAASSDDDSGRLIELLEVQNDEGPSWECLTTGRPVVNADLRRASERWPSFAPRAIEAGFQSVHALPMRWQTQVIGALNLFGTQDVRFDDDEIRVVQALADVATIALLQGALDRAETLTEQLQGALDRRAMIEQAKGAFAHINGVSPAEALDVLRSRARSSRRSLVDVAHEVLAEHEIRDQD